MTHEFEAELWRHTGEAAWHFVTLPDDLADALRAWHAEQHRPFGSLRVTATIGETTWATSLFADTKRGSYLLPVKAEVRRREQIVDGDRVHVWVTVQGS